jgi:hypothetical protein
MAMDWTTVSELKLEDVLYQHGEGIARISINRPEVHNAFRPETVMELQRAFTHAHHDPSIGVIILTGEGGKAFCSGGDQRVRGEQGGYKDATGTQHLNVLDLQMQIRRLPKPVVAMVAGWAIGGGHVLHLVCDLSIAADNARFGQTGPDRRQLRRRARRRAAGAHHRHEEGQGDLVPVPPVRRRTGAGNGAGQHCRAAGQARGRDGGMVPPHARAVADRAAHAQGRRSMPTPTGWRGSRNSPATPPPCST